MIKLRSIKNLNVNEFDEVWVICRSVTSNSAKVLLTNPKCIHVPILSPSTNLFYQYLDWSKRGMWNKNVFVSKYVPEFQEQMENDKKAQAIIKHLANMSKTKNIALCCFCVDEDKCHRSIIGGYLYNMGADIEIKEDYKAYKLSV